MKILVLNCGSSSLKFQLIHMEKEEVLMKGTYERIGISDSFLTVKCDGQKDVYDIEVPDHGAAIEVVFAKLCDPKYDKLANLTELFGIGHRVVHGGEKFSSSVIVTESVKDAIEDVIKLSPLHNPAALAGINACEALAPQITNVVVFDTAFHQTMPEVAYIYNIPFKYYTENKIRKYGFHGTSHRYIAKRASELEPQNSSKLISCHIGQGASICAIKDGESVDTSMGLTPLAGIPMGTRSGNIDPSIVSYICELEHKSAKEVELMLNKESGQLGLSGVSADNRDVEKAAAEGNTRAILALESAAYLTAQTIASYIVSLQGVDMIAFTAGIGENGPQAREKICKYLEVFGVKLDHDKNQSRGEEIEISAPDSKVKVWVIPTNEEIMIAKDTKKLIEQYS